MDKISLKTPLTAEDISILNAGDRVLLNGIIYTARDRAHKKIITMLDEGQKLSFPIRNQVIYYTGPSPSPPGKPVGSAGPTTSYRMDPYTPRLLKEGLAGMIGKGPRSEEVRAAIKKYGAVYFAAWGGAGALIAHSIKKSRVVAFEELGPEAVYELEVENFPVIVVNDPGGKDYYEIAGGITK